MVGERYCLANALWSDKAFIVIITIIFTGVLLDPQHHLSGFKPSFARRAFASATSGSISSARPLALPLPALAVASGRLFRSPSLSRSRSPLSLSRRPSPSRSLSRRPSPSRSRRPSPARSLSRGTSRAGRRSSRPSFRTSLSLSLMEGDPSLPRPPSRSRPPLSRSLSRLRRSSVGLGL